jgi:predicted RNase H-like HicB family nuclease
LAGWREEVLETVAFPTRIFAGGSRELLAVREIQPGRVGYSGLQRCRSGPGCERFRVYEIRGNFTFKKVTRMKNLTLIYWKSEKFYLGKLLEQPEIMTQGETFEELIKNIKDAYYLMMFDDVPEDYQIQEIAL